MIKVGCDCHEVIEIQINGKWFCIGGLTLNRNYYLFSVLANVRNDNDDPMECVSGDAKGLPDSMDKMSVFLMSYGNTESIEKELDDPDHHSHSFLNVKELEEAKEIYEEYLKDKGWKFPEQLSNLKDLLKIPEVEDARFIFCFDN